MRRVAAAPDGSLLQCEALQHPLGLDYACRGYVLFLTLQTVAIGGWSREVYEVRSLTQKAVAFLRQALLPS